MSTTEPFAIVGLTGGIASGKSTVSEMFRQLGVTIIDADLLAREVVRPGEPALEEIREEFGDRVIDQQGELDREALGEIIFSDESARETLDQITHPRIARRMQQKAAEARGSGERWVIYDAALIVENGLHEAFNALIVVAADPDVQVERLTERDDISEQEARGLREAGTALPEEISDPTDRSDTDE